MDLSVESELELDLSDYKTPLLKLARRFKGSADLWRSKYLEVKATIKRFQNFAADSGRSRDGWKEKCQQWEATAERLQAEVDRLRADAAVGRRDDCLQKKQTTVV